MRVDLTYYTETVKNEELRNINLLILDEVFDSSLDNQGTEDFLRLLNTLTEKTMHLLYPTKEINCTISLKSNKIEKHKNFSRIAVT